MSEIVFGERTNFLFNSLVETFNLSIGAVLDELALAAESLGHDFS